MVGTLIEALSQILDDGLVAQFSSPAPMTAVGRLFRSYLIRPNMGHFLDPAHRMGGGCGIRSLSRKESTSYGLYDEGRVRYCR
jgi:hypothetical protein